MATCLLYSVPNDESCVVTCLFYPPAAFPDEGTCVVTCFLYPAPSCLPRRGILCGNLLVVPALTEESCVVICLLAILLFF